MSAPRPALLLTAASAALATGAVVWLALSVGTIVGIAFLVVGPLIASHRPRNPIGWIWLRHRAPRDGCGP